MNIQFSEPRFTLHSAESRGVGEHGWLSARHSFSFANWYNPERMGFGALLVINDDRIAEKYGFGLHGHDNMEIITIVTKGTLKHTDSMGTHGVLVPGDVQVMSAGSGVRHTESNGGEGDLELFQIWIKPDTHNVEPRYDQRRFVQKENDKTLLVSPIGNNEGLSIHQNAFISKISLTAEHPHTYQVKQKGNGVYFFVIEGEVTIEGRALSKRDALGVENLQEIQLVSQGASQILAIEVPMS